MSKAPPTASGLRWLVCPACHGPLQLQDQIIHCSQCSRRYPIVDGIPILLEGRTL